MTSQASIERLIRRRADSFSRFELRVWCALTELKSRGTVPMSKFPIADTCIQAFMAPNDSPICISFQRRRRKIFKSWDRLFVLVDDPSGYRRPGTQDSFWVKIPRLLLRYLARFGTRAEILVALLACCRSLRNRRYQFRFHQARFAETLGLSRESVCKALSRLRQRGFIKRRSSWPGAIKKYGHLYQWSIVLNEKAPSTEGHSSLHI